MKKNEIYVSECLDVTNQGYGIIKVDSIVVFVSGLLPKEKARVRILKVLKNYAFGKIEELLERSEIRRQPLCSIAASCGGCCFQHVEYKEQLRIKSEYVSSLMKDVKVYPTLGMEDPWYYRNKAQFPVQVTNGKVQMGFYRAHSNQIVDCDHCLIQSKEINEVYSYIKEHIKVEQAVGLRHILLRSNEEQEVQVVFIGTENHIFDLSKELVEHFSNIVSIVFNENLRNDNVILGQRYEVLYGSDSITQNCMGQKIRLHFKSFFQVNPKQMEVLYSKAIESAKLDKSKQVIDLYSGAGTISCILALHVKKVIGVEIVKEAVQNAVQNAQINHLENVEFVCADVSDFIRSYKEKTDVVFVDPPRKGLTQTGIQHISMLKPETVVYISCNPNTLARDALLFKEKGYTLKSVQPVDMFCHTNGLECIAVFDNYQM